MAFVMNSLGVMSETRQNIHIQVTRLLLRQIWKFLWLIFFSLISLDHEQHRKCQLPLIPSVNNVVNNIELSTL